MATTMREAWTDERLDDLNKKVDDGFARMETRFDRIEARFDKADERFEAIEERFDKRFDGLYQLLIRGGSLVIAALIGLIATQI